MGHASATSRTRRWLIIFACALTLGALPHTAAATNTYNYTTLNDPNADPSFGSTGDGVNNNGLVVGDYGYYDTHGAGQNAGFIYSGGTYSSFEFPYPAKSCDGSAATQPYGINNSSQVVGYANWYPDETCVNSSSGFIYSNGSFTDLNEPGYGWTVPYSINDSGQVVGFACTTQISNICHGFLWANGSFTDFTHSGSTDTAFESINNLGRRGQSPRTATNGRLSIVSCIAMQRFSMRRSIASKTAGRRFSSATLSGTNYGSRAVFTTA